MPRSDIRIEHCARTEHQTPCPYKGDANYFSLSADGKTAENAVWNLRRNVPDGGGNQEARRLLR
ncbi:DUF427 domain-containing protein [Pseudomonas sp. LS1212]|uniref:DUF427 domain-containing protein n=1 Tax=Pseudomonas sp. LS1212 TaxID=2972478 RepID=UPI0038CD8BF2